MFFERIKDIAGYQIGWQWNLGPLRRSELFRVKKVKVSKVMDKDEYKTTMTIMGVIYVRKR